MTREEADAKLTGILLLIYVEKILGFEKDRRAILTYRLTHNDSICVAIEHEMCSK